MMRPTTVLLVVGLLASCATPLPPSGGPVDSTPPRVENSEPEPGAVRVTGRTVELTFTEYVDQAAFGRALSIAPAPAEPPEIDWSGRTVVIRFAEPLRANTTYVVTLDTGLRDIRNVAVEAPITFAFSTGDALNAGRLSGSVVTRQEGAPARGVDVFAYARTDSSAPAVLPERPSYRTQTDAAGTFRFEYLTEQFYHIVALRDLNRNLAPDIQESVAVPPAAAVFAGPDSSGFGVPWILARLDTTAPEPVRIQSLSTSRHVLRMSEPVRFAGREPQAWSLRDSTSGEDVPIDALYIRPNDARDVYVVTRPLDAVAHELRPAGLVDTSSNPLESEPVAFTPSSVPDTLSLRFLGFLPDTMSTSAVTLPRSLEPGVRFNQPLAQDAMAAVVTVRDSTGTALAYEAVTDDGTGYTLLPDPPLTPGRHVTITVDGPTAVDSARTAGFRRLAASATGEIRGVVAASTGPVIVEAVSVETDVATPRYAVQADSDGVFFLPALAAGTYRLSAYADTDQNGRWTPGLLRPFTVPEPIAWRTDPVRVRARWETSLPDTLRIRTP